MTRYWIHVYCLQVYLGNWYSTDPGVWVEYKPHGDYYKVAMKAASGIRGLRARLDKHENLVVDIKDPEIALDILRGHALDKSEKIAQLEARVRVLAKRDGLKAAAVIANIGEGW